MIFAFGIFSTFFALCVYAIVVNRSSLVEDERVRRTLASAPEMKIAQADGEVILTGRAAAKDGSTVTAPFSGGDALWARARVQTNIGQVVNERIVSVDAMVLDDGSGRAIVAMKDATVRLESESVKAPQGVTGEAEFTYESVLRPGDTISVLGTPTRTGSYRDNTIDVSAITIFDRDREEKQPEQRRRAIGCATFGALCFGLAALVSAYVGFVR